MEKGFSAQQAKHEKTPNELFHNLLAHHERIHSGGGGVIWYEAARMIQATI